jgi:structural maintenance of chromosome 2
MGISRMALIRVEKLQELVYKGGNSSVSKASVTLTFNNTNKQFSPPGYTQYDKISVTRSIENNKVKCMINGRVETQEKVKELFTSVKLNVNNPHFLIMQGRVTKVINMKPEEILGLIEEASGVSQYQYKKIQSLELIKKKELKILETNSILEADVLP